VTSSLIATGTETRTEEAAPVASQFVQYLFLKVDPQWRRLGAPERTRKVIAAIQADGTCWCGVTVWQGRTAMRISVSSWATQDEDVERSLAAIVRVAASVKD